MSEDRNPFAIMTPLFKEQIKVFRQDWYKKYKEISNEPTPQVDGAGRKIVDKRPDGYDFIIEAYMRDCLDRHFPGWSWEMGGAPQFLGGEWVFIWGTLTILDESLIPFNVNPPVRRFSATNGVRVKFKRDKPHTPENVIDVGNDVASANSKAFKKAINQLTHIGDDVYGKRIEEEGAGSLEDIVMQTGDFTQFGRWLEDNKLSWGQAKELLGCEIQEVTDWAWAMKKIKEAKGWK